MNHPFDQSSGARAKREGLYTFDRHGNHVELEHTRRRLLLQDGERRHRRHMRILGVIVGSVVLVTFAVLAKAGGVW